MPNDPFVDVATLSSLGPIRYLDARDQEAFDAGHAPGAVRVPAEEWDRAAKATDIGFDKTAYWDNALGSVGVDSSAVTVTYDGGQMTNAARVWFILQYFGIKAVILNGGWPSLSAASGLPPGAGPSKGGFQAAPGAGSVAHRSARQWCCSSGPGAPKHAGARRIRSRRSHRNPLRGRR
jgi:thiosulfate/3-mercaptopyruvate sulfurtransferase